MSAPDSIQPWLTAHSIYVYGQPRWQAPLVRPLVGVDELPEQTTVLELHRSDGRGILRLLFDPDRVTVSGCASDNPSVNDGRRTYRRALLEASRTNAGRSEGRVRQATMGEGVCPDSGTNESLSGVTKESRRTSGIGLVDTDQIVVKMPRAMTSHDNCGHPNTKTARAACRRERNRGDRAS